MTKQVLGFLLFVTPALVPAVRAQEKPETRFEMTTYYLALLYRGPKSTGEVTPETQRIQEAHMANVRRMADAGKLVLAGPFSDDTKLRGIFVFRVGSLDEAKALAEADPAVQAGRLAPEIHPWFSAKNIVVYPTAEAVASDTKPRAENDPEAEKQIRDLEARRYQALTSNDLTTLGGILADNMTYTHSNGRFDNKAQYMASLQSGELKYESISTDDVVVRVFGPAAVVTGHGTMKARADGQEVTINLRFTDTYVKQGGRWQMVAWESTRIASP